jgi:methionyl-tRNA formyltransferase
MGNPNFSLPALEKVIESNHELISVVSNPPKRMGRGKNKKYTAVGEYAKRKKIPLLNPEALNSKSFSEKLKSLQPDLFVVVAYKILPQSLIEIPKYGSVNLHASILPKYRGAGPIQWALMNGDSSTGVTIFQIKPDVDTGDVLSQKIIEIKDEDNMLSLGMRLCTEGAKLLITVIDKIENDDIIRMPQNKLGVTLAPKITKEMTIINWSWSAKKIHNWVRGLSPFPGMMTKHNNKILRFFKTELFPGKESEIGEVVRSNKNQLVVSTGKGLLSIIEIQLEGKKKLLISEFLNGNTIMLGSRLGS